MAEKHNFPKIGWDFFEQIFVVSSAGGVGVRNEEGGDKWRLGNLCFSPQAPPDSSPWLEVAQGKSSRSSTLSDFVEPPLAIYCLSDWGPGWVIWSYSFTKVFLVISERISQNEGGPLGVFIFFVVYPVDCIKLDFGRYVWVYQTMSEYIKQCLSMCLNVPIWLMYIESDFGSNSKKFSVTCLMSGIYIHLWWSCFSLNDAPFQDVYFESQGWHL